MSTTIDQKVVEMRFDNQHFEKNVSTTMSTLDKLKQKLKFGDSSKGLNEINRAVKNVDMKGLGAGVDAVNAKFSALQVMGVTALANITNSAVNAGKRMASALTIDPIKTGFQEYETQINAVQTILANTSSKGTNIDQVNKALEELNKYADMTIYNFTEMTRNIGTFTAAGVDLDTSVSAIKGIANLAAVSGSTSQQASTAMYQLSQALATGTVKLQDWNSVVNAGMGGEVFQNALKRTAQVMGTDVDALIKKYGSFRESLTRGEWLTTEILTETLNQFTMAAKEGSKEWENYKKSLMDKGYTEQQANEILKMANTATDAATKVKTFTQLWDVLKESAQSGWSQSWKIIIGDFEEAKSLLTPLADVLTGFINKFSEARNKLLESALGKGFTGIGKRLNAMMKSMGKTADGIKEVVDKVSDYSKIVDEIMGGKWGDGQERWDALAKAGYDWAHAQNLVNEKLGDGTRHATNYTEAQKKVAETHNKSAESQDKLNKSNAKYIAALTKKSDAELKEMGLIDAHIKALRDLEAAAEKTGIPLEEFIENIDQIDGRWLLINSFKNAGQGLVTVFKAIGEAWKDAFPPMQANQLFNIIAGLHKFSTHLVMSKETADDLTRTLKGVFALVDILTTVLGGGFKIAFKLVSEVLSYFNTDILSVTANIGDAIVGFRNGFESIFNISKVLDVVVPALKKAGTFAMDWVSSLSDIPMIGRIIDIITAAFNVLKNADWGSIGSDVIAGFSNGLWSGIKNTFNVLVDFGLDLINKFKEAVGVQSPSWKMFEIAQDFIQGFFNGLKALSGTVWDYIKDFGLKCVDAIGKIDWGAVFAVGVSIAMLYSVKKIADALEAFSAPFAGLGDILSEVSGVVKSFGKVTKAIAFDIRTKAIKNLAVSLGILVAAVVALTFVDTKKLWNAVGVIAALAGILVILAIASSKMSDASAEIGKNGVSIDGLKSGLISIGLALLLLAATVKLIGSMNPERAKAGFLGLVGVMAAMLGFLWACKAITKGKVDENITKIAGLMIKMSIALMLMVAVIKMISKLKPEQLQKGAVFAAAFVIFVAALTKIGNTSTSETSKLGGMLIKISIAMMLMVGVLKLVDKLTIGEALKGIAFAAAFALFIKALVWATKVGRDTEIAKIGGLLLSISFSMMLMVGVLKVVGSLSAEEMLKGVIFAGAFLLFVKALISVTTISSDQQLAKVGLTLIAMSVALGIMAAAVAGLSLIDPKRLAGATLAMAMLMTTFGLMAKMAGAAKASIGSLIVMTITITLLAGVLWLLSTLNIELSIINATSLSILLLAVSGAMFILSKMSITIKNALVGVLALTAMAIPMLAFVGVLAVMSNIQNATSNAHLLSELMIVMTAVLAALTIIGNFWITGAIGMVALTAMAIPMLTFVGVLALMNKIQNAESNATLLINLMTTMTKILVVLSIIGPLASMGISAMQGLILLMGEVAVMAGVIGGLMEAFPSLQTFLDTGLPLLERLAESIGTMLGNFIGGIATGISGALPQIGSDLSSFMVNATQFIEGSKLIDETVVTGVSCLSKAILALTGAELINGIASFLSGGISLGGLGSDLSAFMVNAKPFIDGVKLVDPSVAEGAKALSETILILTGANLLEQLTSFITGGSSLSDFGLQMAGLGTHLNTFVSNLGSFDESKATSVEAAAKCIKTLAEAASTLPNEGGWAAKILGDNSLATFGTRLPMLGRNISLFATNLGTFDDSTVTTVDCAAKAIKAIAEAADTLPNEGGWAAKIFGENSIATFGSKLPGLGMNLSSFATNLGTFDESKVATVKCAADAIAVMAKAATNIDGQSEWAKKLFGDNGLATFGGQLGSLGTNLAAFATNLGTFDEAKVATVNAAVRAIKALTGLADANLEGAKANLGGFGNVLGTFGEDVAAMCSGLPSSETLAKAESAIKKVLGLIDSIVSADAKGAANFTNALKKIGTDGVKKFVTAFTNSGATNDTKNAGKKLMQNVIDGAESKNESFTKAVKLIVSDGADAVKDKYNSFYSAGKYLVEGLAAGINENTGVVTSAVSSMASAAAKAAKDALEINSPSKVFRAIGYFIPEGLAMGIDRMRHMVEESSIGMTDTALDGVKGAISRISDVVNGDIDSQPTIRPVLDLSDIQTGAGTINKLLGVTPSVGVMSNVRAINSMMNRNQNGGNAEIVSAIDKLRGDLGNLGGDTYQINGITYGADSEVSGAIQTLVRAMKMEGRT